MGNSTSHCGAPSMFDNNTNTNESNESNQSMGTLKIPDPVSKPEIESLTQSELEKEIQNVKPPIPSMIKPPAPVSKPNIPSDFKEMIGGNTMYRNNLNDPNFYEKPDLNELNEVLQQIAQMNGGGNNELMPIRERYNRYDVFKTIHQIEDNLQGGADGKNGSKNKAMDHIKDIIFEQLRSLEKTKQNGSGGCGCGASKPGQEAVSTGGYIDSSSSSSSSSYSSDDSATPDSSSSTNSSSGDYGKFNKKASKKSKKSKKSSKKNKYNSEDSNFIVETSQVGGSEDSTSSSTSKSSSTTSDDSSSSEKGIKNSTSNGNFNESEEGLSVFPFNSSDVNSISSRKNFRMLRRKI
jgi:hypothetical protein